MAKDDIADPNTDPASEPGLDSRYNNRSARTVWGPFSAEGKRVPVEEIHANIIRQLSPNPNNPVNIHFMGWEESLSPQAILAQKPDVQYVSIPAPGTSREDENGNTFLPRTVISRAALQWLVDEHYRQSAELGLNPPPELILATWDREYASASPDENRVTMSMAYFMNHRPYGMIQDVLAHENTHRWDYHRRQGLDDRLGRSAHQRHDDGRPYRAEGFYSRRNERLGDIGAAILCRNNPYFLEHHAQALGESGESTASERNSMSYTRNRHPLKEERVGIVRDFLRHEMPDDLDEGNTPQKVQDILRQQDAGNIGTMLTGMGLRLADGVEQSWKSARSEPVRPSQHIR